MLHSGACSTLKGRPMALHGQILSQISQNVQRSGEVMWANPCTSVTALVGQDVTHMPQPSQRFMSITGRGGGGWFMSGL